MRLATLIPCLFLLVQSACAQPSIDLSRIRVPPGFKVTLFADDIPGARSLRLGDHGTIFVSTREQGKIHALVDDKGVGHATRHYTLETGLDMPNGIALLNGDLYVAEKSRILRYAQIESHLDRPPKPTVISDRLPEESAHGWRYLGAGPDGFLYVSIGAPCNICFREGYANISRLRPDGTGFQVFAEGIRNSVGFDWNPRSHELWFTDNGRDWLGNNAPPDELNRAPRPGMNFGFPFCHGGEIPDPEFGKEQPCSRFTPPVQKLGPHVAALGMRFYTGDMFPSEYKGQIFIAEHGSWNRSEKIGYRVTLVRLRGDQAASYEAFATGWLDESGDVHGRPVDILVMPDGALLVSDDKGGKVFRISYARQK